MNNLPSKPFRDEFFVGKLQYIITLNGLIKIDGRKYIYVRASLFTYDVDVTVTVYKLRLVQGCRILIVIFSPTKRANLPIFDKSETLPSVDIVIIIHNMDDYSQNFMI